MKKFVLLALIAFSQLAAAQSSRLVQAVVQTAEAKKPGEWRLILQKPDDLSLKDSIGFIVGLDSFSSYRNRNLSVVTVQEISGNGIIASVSTFDEIKVGDVVFLNKNLPDKFSFRGKLFNAAINGIFLSGADGQPYYSWSQIVSGTKTWEDQMLSKMLGDIKKNAANSGQSIEVGSNKGKKISDVIAASEAITMQKFLTLMERVPQVYAGRVLNLNEEFAKWIRAGSTDYSFIDQFVKALTKDQEFENLKKANHTFITRDFLINLTNSSNVLYSAGGPLETYVSTMTSLARLSPDVLSGDDLGYVYFSCASAYDIAKKYQLSFDQFVLAARAYQNVNEIQYARSISRQAESIKLLGDYKKSDELFSKGVELWRQAVAKDPSLYNYSRLRISLEGLAKCKSELEQHQEYLSAYIELASLYTRLILMNERGNAFWSIGYTYATNLKQPELSNQNYEKAYQVFDSIKNVGNAVTVLCNQAVNHRGLKDYKSALEMGQRAEAYAKANLNMEAEGYALNNIMVTLKQDEKNEKALEAAQKLEKLYGTIGLNEKLALVKDEIASFYEGLNKSDEAATVSEEALKLYQTFANGKTLADAYWNAGYYISRKNERVEDANIYYKKAFEYFKDQSATSATTLLSNIAVNYRKLNEKDKCYLAHTEAFQFAMAQKDTTAIIESIVKLYNSCTHFKDYSEAGETAMAIARAYQMQGNKDKAREYCNLVVAEMDAAIKLSTDNNSIANLVKSKAYSFLGDRSLDAANAMYNAGYYQSDLTIALSYYKQAGSMYADLQDNYNLADNHNAIAKTYKNLHYFDSARVEVDKGLALAQSLKRDDLNSGLYNTRAQIHEAQNQITEAMAWYEKTEPIGSLNNKMNAKENIAKLLITMKQYDKAATKYKERLELAPTDGTYSITDMMWNVGYALSFIPERIKESNDYYTRAAALYKKNNEWTNYVTVINNVGINFRDAQDSVNCYKTYQDVLAQIKPKLATATEAADYYLALEKFGYSYKHFKHHTKAMNVRLQAAKGYELLGNSDKAYSLYKEAGESADAAKKYVEGEKYYVKARNAAELLGDKKKMGSAMWSLAYNKGTYQLKSAEALPIWEAAYTYYLEAGDTVNASVMRSNVGQEYWTMLDFNKAIESHNKAIDIATKGKYLSQVSYSWRKLGDLYKKTQNPTKQAEAMNNAIKILEILKDTTELLPAYFDIGYSYGELQEIEKADDYYTRSFALAVAKKDSSNMAMAYYKFAGLYHGIKPDFAKENYKKAIPLQRRLNEKSNLVYSLASLGSLVMESDRLLSEKLLNEALAIAQELNDEGIIAYCHGRLYNQYRDFGKPEMAHQHLDKSTNLYIKLKDKTSLVNNYISYANEYLYDYGDFAKAQHYMASAKLLLDSISNPPTQANFHSQQCIVYQDQGQYDLALAELDKSQEIYTNLKNEWGLAGNYITYGNIYRSLGEYSLAMKYQTMSDSLYDKLNLQYQRLAPIANIGDVYFEQGDYPKALEYFKRSLKIMEDNNDQNTNLCKMLLSVGAAYSYMTNYEEAEKWLVKGLEISKRINASRTRAEILNYLGKLKIETQKYDEAEKFLIEAKTFLIAQNLMIERTSNATKLGHLFLQKGELEKAKAELTEAIELGERFGKSAVLWEGYFRLGDYYRKSKNPQEAKSYLIKSVGVIDKLRNNIVGGEEAKKLFSSDKWILEAYEELISVLLELGETEEAMAWLQKINENNVRDKIRSLDVTFEDEEKNKTLAREKEMKVKLDALEKQIAAQKQAKNQNADQIKNLESVRTIAEGDYLKFVNQTVNVQPELSKYFSNTVQPSQLKGKKKQIPKDMALVSYLVGENKLYIFVATSDTVVARIVSVTKEKIHRDVNAMINITKSHLGNFGTIDLNMQEAERKEVVNGAKQTDPMLKPFEEAYNYLISPISELIATKSRLGIIPTGELNYIPFQMLGKTLKNNKFSMLINQFSMFYTNSTDMLMRNITEDKAIHILAFGNPDKTLPATEKEVEDIKKTFPNTTVYLQDEATEDRAKFAPEEFNVLHFATHGNLDYEDFSKSYLTMAGNKGKNEDGMLTLEELWGMEVMSHLNIVVLSACQTAVTKGSDESSPVSPASGFLQNGVKSVIASLWKVDDEATAILMNDFYKNMKTMDTVDAMRLAQSKLAGNPKFNHPYYWGAMVLIGDWR